MSAYYCAEYRRDPNDPLKPEAKFWRDRTPKSGNLLRGMRDISEARFRRAVREGECYIVYFRDIDGHVRVFDSRHEREVTASHDQAQASSRSVHPGASESP